MLVGESVYLFRAPLLPQGRKHAGFISFFVCVFEALIISLKMFLLFTATLQARVKVDCCKEKKNKVWLGDHFRVYLTSVCLNTVAFG